MKILERTGAKGEPMATPTLKCEASPQRFLRKLKQKNFFNENEYDKL